MVAQEAHQLMEKHLASKAHARMCELIARQDSQTEGSGKPMNPVLVDWKKECKKGGMTW